MTQRISLSARVPREASGQRLDQIAAQLFPDFSRSRIQEWIRRGELTLAGRMVKANTRLLGGESVELSAAPEACGSWQGEAMVLDIIHEDDDIIVINKPAGLVVHPAAGNYEGTLLNGLLHYLPSLESVPRAGIVHRLDKDTTGLMVVAKSLKAHSHLVAQLQCRSVSRIYQALVQGACPAQGLINAPIARDPKNRKRMAVVDGGKEAITHFHVISRFGDITLVQLRLESGRTHQIRVHMTHIGLPLIGDPAYGRIVRKSAVQDPDLRDLLNQFPRQALHACQLSLEHPVSGEPMSWQAPIPADFNAIKVALARAMD